MKILFTDLDGTLLTDDKRISETDMRSIRAMIDAGHKFVMTTGRPLAQHPHQAHDHGECRVCRRHRPLRQYVLLIVLDFKFFFIIFLKYKRRIYDKFMVSSWKEPQATDRIHCVSLCGDAYRL
jgi:hypothetical protein